MTINKFPSSSIKKRMINGMFWSFSGTALAKFLTLIAGIICAHILRKELYGEFCMVRSTINMFVVFGSAGLGVTATKYISEYRKGKKEKISHIYYITNIFGIITGILFTSLIIVFSSQLSSNILNEPRLSSALQIGSILLFFSVLNGVQNGALAGFEDFQSIAINTLIGSIFELIFMLAGAYFFSVNGAILGFGIGFIAIYITNKLSISRLFKINKIRKTAQKKFNKQDWKILYNYSLPAALSSFLIAPAFWIIRSMLVRYKGFGDLAIYEAADQWKIIILFIPTAISQIVLPILSSLQKEGNNFEKTLKLNLLIIGLISIIISLIVIFASSFIIGLYGQDFKDALPLKILAASSVFSAIANILEMSAYSMGKMWQCFIVNIIWAFCMIVFTYIFLHKEMGASGLAYAVLFAYIISCSIFAFYTWQLIKSHQKEQIW